MQKVVLATGNAGKVRELSGALADFGIEIVAQSALGVASVQETGLTFIENALIKARHAARVTGLPAIADDSGLAVNALAGGPGIYSARYASEEASDRENLDKLLGALATVPHGQRGAQFHCVLVYLRHTNDPTPLVCHGSWSGEIACQSSGTGAGSFGYDPVFLLTEQGCTAADLTAKEKQAISHRAQALLSLYLHVPWCVKKCPYCDFNSHELHGEVPHQDYVDHLLADLEHDIPLTSGRTVDTLFIGGGTPSLLSSSAMRSLLDGVRQRLPLLPNAEITMEANPGTIEVDRFAAYQLGGINRISIGVQSFEPEKLASLGRIHGAEEARRAARLAASLGLCSFNLDLMNGLPDQSLAGALDDLTQAIALQPPHLSWYQLTIEPNTLFGSRPPVLPNDDALWDIYQHGDRLLTAAGYRQYETSTYAFPGFQCHHNLNYWRFGDYLGIGCGAHGKLTQFDGTILRTVKTRNPRGYMQGNYLAKRYQVAPTELPFEYFMNRFRLLEASPRVEFAAFTGLTETTVRYALDRALAGGYISESDSHWQVTDHGKLFLNSLLEMFI